MRPSNKRNSNHCGVPHLHSQLLHAHIFQVHSRLLCRIHLGSRPALHQIACSNLNLRHYGSIHGYEFDFFDTFRVDFQLHS